MKNTTSKTKSFEFKQFKVEGGYSGMPVSTDGVLLGAWCELDKIKTLLDIGTGTGLLALMAAQRNANLIVSAIDINTEAIAAAQYNFEQSAWAKRLTLYHGDVLSYQFTQPFDAIVCNPPYFNSGEQSKFEQRAIARHTDTLNHLDLLARCYSLLQPDGYACFVLPTVEGNQFIELATATGWSLQKLCHVKPNQEKAENRLLFQLGKRATNLEENHLNIRDKQSYSDEFIALTKDFYLKM